MDGATTPHETSGFQRNRAARLPFLSHARKGGLDMSMRASGNSDRLGDYRRKRDFSRTREPSGASRRRTAKDKPAFVVQKHDATRLHYDFRLEQDGVLWSWAVTRGPSANPDDKRLAVRTEDHPLDYGDFEGTIPAGQYGGGTVMLWDRGWWEPLNDPAEGIAEGKLHFRLHGERMNGGWALVRMKPRKGEKHENWLLIKERDDRSSDDGEALIRKNTDSVKTGRSMDEIAIGDDSPEWRSGKARGKGHEATAATATRSGKGSTRGARSGKPPAFEKPQLAMLVADAPEGDEWLHEVKFDGYRMLAAVGGEAVRCFTRSGLDWSGKFSEIAEALAGLRCRSALIDGEVLAAAKAGGHSTFSALQKALKSGDALTYRAFDLLSLDGTDWRDRPQIKRKERLEKLLADLPDHSPVRYSEHIRGHGARVLKGICEAGEEGIVSKRVDAPYRSRRGRNWLKIKCTKRQEFVIGGFSPSDKKERPFASLLLGTYEGGRLVYRGRVGTGFDQATMVDLAGRFSSLERKSMPFDAVPRERAKDARWLAPRLVAEVDFAEFTDDGHVRHGAFLGLREDKEAEAVTIETRVPSKAAAGHSAAPAADMLKDTGGDDDVLRIRITHPGRILFAEQGVTKIDLARYYAVAADRMLQYAADHPLSLVRCPQGPRKTCFFQKHANEGFPAEIRQVPIREKSGKSEDYLYVHDAAGLVAAVQMGTLEFHIWGSSIGNIEKPDRMIFDLDPDEGLDFARVKQGAVMLRDRLADIGLESVPMVTGGKGVHVIVPLERRADWTAVKGFARGLATGVAAEDPDHYTATMSKQKRKGRIFIDWLRNERGATAVAPYSTRSRTGAPIATPVSWEELLGLNSANGLRIVDVLNRLEADDPWQESRSWRQSLTKKMLAGSGS